MLLYPTSLVIHLQECDTRDVASVDGCAQFQIQDINLP